MLSVEIPFVAIVLARFAPSTNAVTAPTPPEGLMTWIASPITVTLSDDAHGLISGLADRTLSGLDCVLSCKCRIERMLGSQQSVTRSDISAASSPVYLDSGTSFGRLKMCLRAISTQYM